MVRFVEKLPTGRRGNKKGTKYIKWKNVLDRLKSRPRQWAIVKTASTQNAAGGAVNQLKAGQLGGLANVGKYEFVRRGRKVYARYVGRSRKA